jgi:hypothetical protein
MNPPFIGLVVFVCVFGVAMLGMFLSSRLPDHHQSSESKDVVRLGMGLVATTVAVVLGLLVSSAKNFYDTQNSEVAQLAANFVMLDLILSAYGPEAADTRTLLRTILSDDLRISDRSMKSNQAYNLIKSGARIGETLVVRIQKLAPGNDNQRFLKTQALSVALQLGQTRWLMFEQNSVPIPKLLLVMLFGWLIVLFLSFGIFAPRNLTVTAGLFLAALGVCGAVLLILEMYLPQAGLIRVSDEPLRTALNQLGQ